MKTFSSSRHDAALRRQGRAWRWRGRALAPSYRWRRHASDWFWRLVVGAFVVIIGVPVVAIAGVSLESLAQVDNGDVLSGFHLDNYVQAWSSIGLGYFLLHSLVVAVSCVAIVVVVAVGMAYVLARFAFRLRSAMALGMLVGQLIPGVSVLLPIYVLYADAQSTLHLDLIGGLLGLILIDAATAIPLAVWLLMSNFDGVPRELDEAAVVDGATRTRALLQVLVPVMLPGIAVVGIFSFLAAWNDVLFASVLTSDSTRTVAIGLEEYIISNGSGSGAVLWNELMAAALISAVPAVVFFFAAQRFVVNGLTAGAVRG